MNQLEAVVENSKRLARTTRRQYKRVARDFAAFAGNDSTRWTPASCDDWVQRLVEHGVKPVSINAYVAALRWASRRWAALHDGARDFAGALESVLVPVEKRATSPTPLDENALDDLLASCSRTSDPTDLRDRAIIAVAINTGLRRAEIAGIEFADLDRDERSIVVVAKRNKRHRVCVSAACWARLDAWIEWLRRRHVEFSGRVFRSLRRCLDCELGWSVGGGVSPEAVYRIVRRRARRAGIRERVCAHTLRHSLVAILRKRGVREEEIARRLGHQSVETTARYGGERVREVLDEELPT